MEQVQVQSSSAGVIIKCPRCDSSNTKFCYYNNYSLSQPRHLCKACKRYWTRGGTLRNVPVGGGCRKNKTTTKGGGGGLVINKNKSSSLAFAKPSTTPLVQSTNPLLYNTSTSNSTPYSIIRDGGSNYDPRYYDRGRDVGRLGFVTSTQNFESGGNATNSLLLSSYLPQQEQENTNDMNTDQTMIPPCNGYLGLDGGLEWNTTTTSNYNIEAAHVDPVPFMWNSSTTGGVWHDYSSYNNINGSSSSSVPLL